MTVTASSSDPNGRITVETLTKKCIASIDSNSALNRTFGPVGEAGQRAILTAWYEGLVSSPTISGSMSNPSTSNPNLPSLDNFVNHALPEVRRSVTAAA